MISYVLFFLILLFIRFFLFRKMIEPVADQLAIPRGNIFANRLLFDKNGGNYTGFDAEEPTSRDGGKPKVIDL